MNKFIILIAAATVAAAISATTSYFSDKESSPNNEISAGTLDLTLNETAKSPNALLGTNWNPGDELEQAIILRNDGTLPIDSISLQAETEVSN
jgi:predicted ribosomally synthesized peptide with SipW-like signal peptide